VSCLTLSSKKPSLEWRVCASPLKGGGIIKWLVNAKVNRDGKTASTSWRSAENKGNFTYKFSKFSGIHHPAIAIPLWGWGWSIFILFRFEGTEARKGRLYGKQVTTCLLDINSPEASGAAPPLGTPPSKQVPYIKCVWKGYPSM
jgi:hypothetical protein